jgi:hypothetical protein
MRKPKVGEKLWMVKGTNYSLTRGEEVSGEVCTVVSSGRKYFKVAVKNSFSREITFHIDTWRQKTEYSPDYILYKSKQIWEDEVESREYLFQYSNIFQYNSCKKYTLQQLRDVAKILKVTLEEKNNEVEED